jgi:hypothetical protein
MKTQMLIGAMVLTGVVLTGAAALSGQTKVEYGGAAFQFAGVGGTEFKVFGVEGIGSQLVTGRPFSATEERHSVQVLGDGTHIETAETNRLFRDDQGRTRVERASGNVMIFDPVAGFSAELIPSTREVSKSGVMVREGRVVGRTGLVIAREGPEALRSNLAKLREELAQAQKQYTETHPQVVKLRAAISDLEKAIAAAPQPAGANGEVRALPAQILGEFAPRNSPPQAGGERLVSNVTADGLVVLRVAPGDNASVESLPAQMINGALAQGTRTTETIPQGKIGNDRPIVIVNERWISNDLQMLVKSTSSDPRFGDTTYQLTNIVQASPDPSLFQIPADYTLRK